MAAVAPHSPNAWRSTAAATSGLRDADRQVLSKPTHFATTYLRSYALPCSEGRVVKQRREPRPKLPTELPLDDGARCGTDPWRDRRRSILSLGPRCFASPSTGPRVAWDRAVSSAAPLQPHAPDVEAEALLAQLADLTATPGTGHLFSGYTGCDAGTIAIAS
jgi:hypothetical protein